MSGADFHRQVIAHAERTSEMPDMPRKSAIRLCFYGWAAFRPPARRIFCGICFLWDACCFQRFCGIGSPGPCRRMENPCLSFSPCPISHPFFPIFGLSSVTGISPLPPDCPLISHICIYNSRAAVGKVLGGGRLGGRAPLSRGALPPRSFHIIRISTDE